MALSAHIAALETRHRAVDAMIQEEAAAPATDNLEIQRLKKEKLRLKDEIARLGTTH